MVQVSQTINFSDPSNFTGVDNANVSIQEDQKEPIKLIQTAAGIYESGILQTKPLSTYKLSVKVDGQEFISTVKVPEAAATCL